MVDIASVASLVVGPAYGCVHEQTSLERNYLLAIVIVYRLGKVS